MFDDPEDAFEGPVRAAEVAGLAVRAEAAGQTALAVALGAAVLAMIGRRERALAMMVAPFTDGERVRLGRALRELGADPA